MLFKIEYFHGKAMQDVTLVLNLNNIHTLFNTHSIFCALFGGIFFYSGNFPICPNGQNIVNFSRKLLIFSTQYQHWLTNLPTDDIVQKHPNTISLDNLAWNVVDIHNKIKNISVCRIYSYKGIISSLNYNSHIQSTR